MIFSIGCGNRLVVRLVIVRFENNIFRFEGIEEVFFKVWMIMIFLVVDSREYVKCNLEIVKIKFGYFFIIGMIFFNFWLYILVWMSLVLFFCF